MPSKFCVCFEFDNLSAIWLSGNACVYLTVFISPPERVRRSYVLPMSFLSFFLTPRLIISQKAVKSISEVWSYAALVKLTQDISPIPPLIFTGEGSKSAKFGLNVQPSRPSFEREQRI